MAAPTTTQALGELLPEELIRNEALMVRYAQLPNESGWFGTMAIQADLVAAHRATAAGDVVAMIHAYEKLKGNK